MWKLFSSRTTLKALQPPSHTSSGTSLTAASSNTPTPNVIVGGDSNHHSHGSTNRDLRNKKLLFTPQPSIVTSFTKQKQNINNNNNNPNNNNNNNKNYKGVDNSNVNNSNNGDDTEKITDLSNLNNNQNNNNNNNNAPLFNTILTSSTLYGTTQSNIQYKDDTESSSTSSSHYSNGVLVESKSNTTTPILIVNQNPQPKPHHHHNNRRIDQSLNSISLQYKTSNNRFNSEFDAVEVIGRGGYGVVYRAVNLFDQEIYAIKRTKIKCLDQKELNEVRIMAKFNHPNIIRYYNSWVEYQENEMTTSSVTGSCDGWNLSSASNSSSGSSIRSALDIDYSISSNGQSEITNHSNTTFGYVKNQGYSTGSSSNRSYGTSSSSSSSSSSPISSSSSQSLYKYLYIQMEYCSFGTLRQWMNNRPINRTECKDIIKQILTGLSFIHQKGYVHRDITPDNIFITKFDGLNLSNNNNNNNNDHQWCLKIGDFGLSTTIESLNKSNQLTNNDNNSQYIVQPNKPIGTYLYSSTEQETGQQYNHRTDGYSVGAIYYELLSHFKTTTERVISLTNLKTKNILPTTFKLLFPKESAIIEKLICKLDQRISCEKLLMEEEFFNYAIN